MTTNWVKHNSGAQQCISRGERADERTNWTRQVFVRPCTIARDRKNNQYRHHHHHHLRPRIQAYLYVARKPTIHSAAVRWRNEETTLLYRAGRIELFTARVLCRVSYRVLGSVSMQVRVFISGAKKQESLGAVCVIKRIASSWSWAGQSLNYWFASYPARLNLSRNCVTNVWARRLPVLSLLGVCNFFSSTWSQKYNLKLYWGRVCSSYSSTRNSPTHVERRAYCLVMHETHILIYTWLLLFVRVLRL